MIGYKTVLGMNLRNCLIDQVNPRSAQKAADSKQEAKDRMEGAGVCFVPSFAVLRDRLDTRRFDFDSLPDSWVVKPNGGAQGRGIVLATDRDDGDGWKSPSGKSLSREWLRKHLDLIAAGEFSSGSAQTDWILFEPLIRPHKLLADMSEGGLPDIRIICYKQDPVMAMLRVPTKKSDGKANLHRGAVGVGIEIESGRTTRAEMKRKQVTHHPDNGMALENIEIPFWDDILTMSEKASEVLGLGYAGLDITLDEERGAVLIEGNAHPGLEIQNVNLRGLETAASRVFGGKG